VSNTEHPDQAEKHGWSTVFNLVMLVVGAFALAWMLRETKWHELRNVIVGVGVWGAVFLVIEVASLLCDAAALHAFMRPEARMVSYLRVLGAQASGRAINAVTPLGALGEATKVTMLAGHAPRARVLSSLVLLNVAKLYLEVAFILIGIPITMLLIDLPDTIRVIALIGIAVLVPAMIAIGVMIHRGAVSSLVGIVRTARLISAERAKTWKSKLTETDKHIRELHTHRTAGTRAGLFYVLLSKVLTTASTILIMVALDMELSWSLVIGVLSVGVLVQWVASVVPLGLGLADGGNYALYEVLGASGDHGMYFTILWRLRTVFIAVLGLGAMAVINAYARYEKFRISRRLHDLKAARDST
jgi:uncharacterized protein (TIRG00374 family)